MNEKRQKGRPTRYKKEYNEQARKLCLLGYTDAELADFFDVQESTINNWKKKHPDFLESIRAGKAFADMDVVESLHKSTQDRTVIERKAFKVKEKWVHEETGKIIERESIVYADEERIIPSDTKSIQFWLKNRQPQHWREKQEEKQEAAERQQAVIIMPDGQKLIV